MIVMWQIDMSITKNVQEARFIFVNANKIVFQSLIEAFLASWCLDIFKKNYYSLIINE